MKSTATTPVALRLSELSKTTRTPLLNLLFIPGLSLLNRAAGRDEWFPGRNIYAVIPLTALLGYLLTWSAEFALALGLSMATYRLPGWYSLLDMGRNNPDYWDDPTRATARDFSLMCLRQTWIAPIFVYLFWGDWLAILQLTALAGLAGGLGYMTGHLLWLYDRVKTPGLWAELAAGAYIGSVIAVATTVWQS